MITFKCGCKFEGDKNSVKWVSDLKHTPLDCSATWNLISEGNTKGIFQLDSQLGRSLAQKLQPCNIEQLAALVSTMRPGCMEAIIDGKSITEHYIERKHGREEVTYIHPALEPILKTNYGLMIYQEDALRIAKDIGGFNLQESDLLRRSVGKKKADLMAQVKSMFLDGCENHGVVNKEIASELFDWIEKSQRYSFNKSHAVAYAMDGYLSAYAKTHFPKQFYCKSLEYAKYKPAPYEEIKELVNDARKNDVEVLSPDFRLMNKDFKIIDNKVVFGICNIKGVGESVFHTIVELVVDVEKKLGKKLKDIKWIEFLIHLATHIKKDAVKSLIDSGALDYFGISRSRMNFEFERIIPFKGKQEERWIISNGPFESLEQTFNHMLESGSGKGKACANKNRLENLRNILSSLQKPSTSLKDIPLCVSESEESLLGVSLASNVIDGCDTSFANATCKDFLNGYNSQSILIAAKVERINEVYTRNGDKMAFVSLSDSSAMLDSVICWPNVFDDFCNLLIIGNTIVVKGYRKKDNFIIQKVFQV